MTWRSLITSFGDPLAPSYTAQDLSAYSPERDLGEPGHYPFTRGVYPTMYRTQPWTMRQYAGFATASETNQRFKYLLAQGQTGLSVAFDLPTQMGRDSDHPLARGEVGQTGVAIDSLADMECLFEGIPLDQVSTSMTINAPAAVLLAMYIAVGQKQGVHPDQLRGTIQNDILKEYIARNTYIFPPQPSLRLIADTCVYCAEAVPKWNTISVSGYHMREAGANSIQEVAFTLANARQYLETIRDRGVDLDTVAPRLSFFFSGSKELLEEVAKYRAARRLWARMCQEDLGLQNPKSWMLRFHVQTAGSSLTAQQLQNNTVRTTIEALAAILGGAQSVHTNAHDEALSLPSADSARTALRIQQILAYETDVTLSADPLGGSYLIESLTNQIEAGARQYFEKIAEMGGVMEALHQGFFHREIQECAYQYQRSVEKGQTVVVGVNRFQEEEPEPPATPRMATALEQAQRNLLQHTRQTRDNQQIQHCLAQLRTAAQSTDNLLPLILAAVHAYATVGEICDVLRDEWGEYRPEIIF